MTGLRPQGMVRFHGADPTGRKFGFDLKFERLMEKQEGLVIGRDLDHCDTVLPHSTVSRRHARLVLANNILHIEDIGSTNGTSVDGTVVEPGVRQPLRAGARLRIGDVELAVQYE